MTVNWLYEADFSPAESSELLDFAVMFARARIDYAVYGERYHLGNTQP